MKRLLRYFSKLEWAIWSVSVCITTVFFCIFDRSNLLSYFATVVGETSLIFIAKGNPIGQVLTLAFCVMYGLVAYTYAYYGEMITYLGMSLPMAVFALIAWLRHPSDAGRAEVKVNVISRRETAIMLIATAAVTVAFYFILRAFRTANLVPSTISVTTSFAAAYLIFRRSRFFALAYAINDIVLIVLWALACATDITYISTLICFVAFFANDVYSFINWKRIQRRQSAERAVTD